MGAKRNVVSLIKYVVIRNNSEFTITNIKAELALIFPAGISRTTVRSFFASICLSIYRLKDIAAFLAQSISRITKIKTVMFKELPPNATPQKKPTRAKGKANIV